MAPRERSDDDEMDLINAEFESMVADLNLDQSSPRTYLDELAEIENEELAFISNVPLSKAGIRKSLGDAFSSMKRAIKRWWGRDGGDDGRDDQGAVL